MEERKPVEPAIIQSVAVGDRLYALPNLTEPLPIKRVNLSGWRVFLFCLVLSAISVAFLDQIYRLVLAADDHAIRRMGLVFSVVFSLLMVLGYALAFWSALGKGSQDRAPFTTRPEELCEPNATIKVRYEGGSSGRLIGTLWIESNRLRFLSPQTMLDLNKREVAACHAEHGYLRLVLKSQPKGLDQVTIFLRIPKNPETGRRLKLFRDAIRALPETPQPSIVPAPWSPYYQGSLAHAWQNLCWAPFSGLAFTPAMLMANRITERIHPAWQVALACSAFGFLFLATFTSLPIFMERLYARRAHKLGFPMPLEVPRK